MIRESIKLLRQFSLLVILIPASIVAAPSAFCQQENAKTDQSQPNDRSPKATERSQSVKSATLVEATDLKQYKFEKHGAIEYASGDDYRLTLDVYVPEGEGPFPTVLCIHGGSWRSGTKINWIRHAWKIAKRGFVVVAINYRHAPKHKYPAQIHDCKAAVRWMRTNADEYKINPEQICGLGYSAGGHLAALLGVTDPDDGLEGEVSEAEKDVSTRLQVVAAGGAPCEFSWIGEDSRSLSFWLGDTPKGNPEIYRLASPTIFITDDDPPFYFFHGESDWIVPPESSKKMHELLLKQGVQSRYQVHDDYGHFALFSYTDALDPILDYFEETLQIKKKP